jgi:hypothetical protein
VEARPESGDVVRTSSLRDAVLGVGPIKKGGDMEAAKEVQVEDAKKAREYSGAWPWDVENRWRMRSMKKKLERWNDRGRFVL